MGADGYGCTVRVDPPLLRLVRERLESVLCVTVAHAVLFDALARSSRRVRTVADMLELACGPLWERLADQVGEEEATAITEMLARNLVRADETGEADMRQSQPQGRVPRERPTTPMLGTKLPVEVAVAASSGGFAEVLAWCLGHDRVAPFTVGTTQEVRRALRPVPPILAIVNGDDPPGVRARDLAEELAAAPCSTLLAVWGIDRPYGAEVAEGLAGIARPCVAVDRGEGVAPLLDLVRSRHQT
jgi:hypothetical protein